MLKELGSIITLLGFTGSVVLVLARSVWLTAQVKEKVDRIDADFRSHIEASHLHRNADSEARWKRLEDSIDSLTKMMNDIRAELARRKDGGTI